MSPSESASLVEAGIHALYWQISECEWKGDRWNFNEISRPQQIGVNGIEIIPVIRIKPNAAFLGARDSAGLLVEKFKSWQQGGLHAFEIQLDFDCPSRQLEDYARFIDAFSELVKPAKVSITALASWPESPGFPLLVRSVSMLAPMFYDLEKDDAVQDIFYPLGDPASTKWISLWKSCPKPWLAGLADFERVSVFSGDGVSKGHLRGWNRDALFFHDALRARDLKNGVTEFRSQQTISFYGQTIPPEWRLVHRTVSGEALTALMECARQNGASGMVFFALPGPGMQSAFTPMHLSHILSRPAPDPHVTFNADGTVSLYNAGPADIPAGTWTLEVKAGSMGAFQSASPGGFVNCLVPSGGPVEMADKITLGFSGLAIGETLTSGRVMKDSVGVTWNLSDSFKTKSVPSQ